MKMLMVTVYFVGLINIKDGREVIAPWATPGKPRGTVMLHPHAATIFIKGLQGPTDCAKLLGQVTPTGNCKVVVNQGSTVILPVSPVAFNATANVAKLPSLRQLCPGISGLNSLQKHAVRVTLSSGTLDACTNDKQWISFLTTIGGELEIRVNNLVLKGALKNDAIVWIENLPTGMVGTDPEPHFWWYYELYNGTMGCLPTPTDPKKTIPCPKSFPRKDQGTSGDVGCSNSNYP